MNLKKYWNKKLTQKAIFYLTVLTCAVIIIAILYNTPLIVGKAVDFVGWVVSVLTGFIAGFVVAYLLTPVVVFFQKLLMKIPLLKTREKLARGLGVALTYIIIFGAIIVGLIALIFAITKSISDIDFNELPKLISSLEVQVYGLVGSIESTLNSFGIETEAIEEWLGSVGATIAGALGNAPSGVGAFAGGVTSFFSNVLFAVIFSIYFMLETEDLMAYWNNAFKALLGEKAHHVICVLIDDADKCFSGYIRGQFADALFMAAAVAISLSIVGVPYAVVIGILTGIGNLIPYIGPFVAYGMTLAVCIASGKWVTLVIGMIVILILQTIDGNVINPKLLSQSIDVHPVLIIVGLLFGSAVGGLLGMLLAVPVASFIKIQFERLVDFLTQRRSNESPQSDRE